MIAIQPDRLPNIRYTLPTSILQARWVLVGGDLPHRARHHTTLSAFGFAAEDGGASKAEPASAALIAVANSCGVRYPKLLCGRFSLYSIFHAPILRRASNKF